VLKDRKRLKLTESDKLFYTVQYTVVILLEKKINGLIPVLWLYCI